MKLDLKDRKILYELDLDSRQPYSTLAKKVGLSKDSVNYRIRRLQEQGIIKGFHTVIDTSKLGLISFRLFLNLQNETPAKQVEIIEFLKAQEHVTWIVSIDGPYDIGMWVLTPSHLEMNAFWKRLSDTYLEYIAERRLGIFTKVSYYPRSYLLDKKRNTEEFVFITESQKADIDETDIAILRLLAPDARISVLELAHKTGLTPKTVTTRINALERKRIIVGYRTMFDIGKLGYQYFKLHLNLRKKDRIAELRQYIRQHPNIIYDNEILGGDDVEIDLQVESPERFRVIVAEMKERFSDIIKDHSSMTYYAEHKYVYFPL